MNFMKDAIKKRRKKVSGLLEEDEEGGQQDDLSKYQNDINSEVDEMASDDLDVEDSEGADETDDNSKESLTKEAPEDEDEDGKTEKDLAPGRPTNPKHKGDPDQGAIIDSLTDGFSEEDINKNGKRGLLDRMRVMALKMKQKQTEGEG